MRRGPRRLASLLALATVTLVGVAACASGTAQPAPATGDFRDCAVHQNTCNSGTRIDGGTIVTVSEKDVFGWNLNDAADNTLDFSQIMTGLMPTTFILEPDYSVALNTDLLESAEQTRANPQTIVYKIKKSAVWNDGTPISADDFIWQWQTQSGTGQFCPYTETGCNAASTSGYNQIKTVTSSDNGATATVVFKTPFTDWKSLFVSMYPAHVAQKATNNGTLLEQWQWFSDLKNIPTWSGGPMQIKKGGFVDGASVTLEPNPKWYGGNRSTLDSLTYKIVTDQTVEEPALANGEVNMLFPQPNRDLVQQVRGLDGVKSSLDSGLNWEHIDFNLKKTYLQDPELRKAIFMAIDRKQILAGTVGQYDKDIQPLGNHMFVPGLKGYQDNMVGSPAGTGDIDGATKVLTAAGYKINGGKLYDKNNKALPPLKYLFTVGNTDRATSAEIVRAALAKIGITINPAPEKQFGPDLFGGNFDLVQFAWTGAPFPSAGAFQIFTPQGGSDFCNFDDKTAVDLMVKALQQTDPEQANAMLNQADKIMTDQNVVLPLFQKPMFLATGTNVVGIRPNGTQAGPAYNVGEWGLRANNNVQ